MHLKIPAEEVKRLSQALDESGQKEIGGQIYGEQEAPSEFKVVEFTIQKRRGTLARFVVDVVQAAKDAFRFFDRTNHRYERFNYIGEWHSHPSFSVQPSSTDLETMRRLVGDGTFQGTFAILMITRLDNKKLTLGAWFFDPQGQEGIVSLECEL